MIQLYYNGVDITNSVSVKRCYHDMYAGGYADSLNIQVDDKEHLWDVWAPAAGDEIQVDYDQATTGIMFLASVKVNNGYYSIEAHSAPPSGFVKQSKAWQQVRLLQIGAEIAERNGLSFSSYGVTDQLYPYISQDNVSDFFFLAQRARLESCAFQVFNKHLVLYSEPYIESVAPAESIALTDNGVFEYRPRQADLYGSCEVLSGQYSGIFTADNGSSRIYRPDIFGGVSSNAEAERFAKGLLRSVNKGCIGGFIRIPIQAGYAAGSMISLSNPRATSMDGPIFLDHVRHDYVTGYSKVFFHKPLEGY